MIKNQKTAQIFTWIFSGIVLVLVGVMRKYKIDLGIDFSFLPPIHALLNSMCAVALIAAYYFIKNKEVEMHRKSIYVALGCSALFFICYILYHFTTEETKYCGEGLSRTIYFVFLITHIVLAGFSLPFILTTYFRAYRGDFVLHKKMARWIFPIWLYVAISGPICYFMLMPCYR